MHVPDDGFLVRRDAYGRAKQEVVRCAPSAEQSKKVSSACGVTPSAEQSKKSSSVFAPIIDGTRDSSDLQGLNNYQGILVSSVHIIGFRSSISTD